MLYRPYVRIRRRGRRGSTAFVAGQQRLAQSWPPSLSSTQPPKQTSMRPRPLSSRSSGHSRQHSLDHHYECCCAVLSDHVPVVERMSLMCLSIAMIATRAYFNSPMQPRCPPAHLIQRNRLWLLWRFPQTVLQRSTAISTISMLTRHRARGSADNFDAATAAGANALRN